MQAWREACAPLYHCRCSICERAILKANIAAGNVVPTQAPQTTPAPPPQESAYFQQQQRAAAENKPITIHIQKPTPRAAAAVEEEEEDDSGDSILDTDDDAPEENSDLADYLAQQRTLQPGKMVYPVTPRKRSSQELEADGEAGGGDVFMGNPKDTILEHDLDDVRRSHNGSPPKRARMDVEGNGSGKGQRQRVTSPTPTKGRTTAPLPLPRNPVRSEGKGE